MFLSFLDVAKAYCSNVSMGYFFILFTQYYNIKLCSRLLDFIQKSLLGISHREESKNNVSFCLHLILNNKKIKNKNKKKEFDEVEKEEALEQKLLMDLRL